LRLPSVRIGTVYEIELKCRYILHYALWGHHTDRLMFGANGDEDTDDVLIPGILRIESSNEGRTTSNGRNVSNNRRREQIDNNEIGDDASHRIEATRKLIPQGYIDEVLSIYRSASNRFRASAILQVFFARFYATFSTNRHMQLSHLLQAERRRPALDMSYQVCLSIYKLCCKCNTFVHVQLNIFYTIIGFPNAKNCRDNGCNW
jgi:hypothetical protein